MKVLSDAIFLSKLEVDYNILVLSIKEKDSFTLCSLKYMLVTILVL